MKALYSIVLPADEFEKFYNLDSRKFYNFMPVEHVPEFENLSDGYNELEKMGFTELDMCEITNFAMPVTKTHYTIFKDQKTHTVYLIF